MKLLRRLLLAFVALVVIAYVGVLGYIFLNQRALQYSATGPVFTLADTKLGQARDVAVKSGDALVNGWYQAPAPGKPVIMYYKGNSQSFSEENERYEQFVAGGYGFLAFDYRGFPASPGEISEANILTDALAAYDWLDAQTEAPIMIWGRSLGSGPATYVASQRDASALLLETPFLSAVGVAAERYPILPVGLVMQDQFRSDLWIKQVSEPVLVAHGTADRTIGVTNGERLYALAPNPDAIWIVPGAGHSDLWDAGIWNQAEPFFERALAP
ncbi:alpha/beta hydrolase [Devosia sp. XJ19-1]|uniref:Alpha/beta hydrolase n=1 Tax=Devosia ureilytica TaxID=2952754 RepID=A0A9Q4AR38_9HYPH|nr:alpha/beta hydrolase [Devosia ureilytica]MCP8884654.1 alpha/beta hydrolase [Devosia ureilytica]MCP8888285.1 alpha/beta hydrolase [Devosia ureilytica]